MNMDTSARKMSKTHELTFIDDFNKKDLNTDSWRTDHYYSLPIHPDNIILDNKAPDVIYTNCNYIMSDGKIYMYTKKENVQYHFQDWSGKDWGSWVVPYSSGQIQHNTFEQKYGYFEACLSIPQTPGISPAFSLCSKHSWPPEINVFDFYTGKKKEYFGNKLQYKSDDDVRQKSSKSYALRNYNSLNVWAVDWQEEYIKFYWNNILIHAVYDKHVLECFDVPMFVVICNGIDVNNGSRLKEMESPNFMSVDWVRVWKKLD